MLNHLRELVITRMSRLQIRVEAAAEIMNLKPQRTMQESHPDADQIGGFGELLPPGQPDARAAIGANAENEREARGARRHRPRQLGQGRPQRALPLRLGQEIQAVPRGAGLALALGFLPIRRFHYNHAICGRRRAGAATVPG